MNLTRIATFGAAGGVLAAMIAGATTSGPRRAAPPPVVSATTGIELKGAELAAEVARLRERLRPSIEPAQPSRNLFQFRARAPRVEAAPPDAAPAPLPMPLPPAPPPFALVGLAADAGPDGPVRTAIISGFGDLFLVREGETVGAQYRVATIAGDGVELTNLTDGSMVRLVLK